MKTKLSYPVLVTLDSNLTDTILRDYSNALQTIKLDSCAIMRMAERTSIHIRLLPHFNSVSQFSVEVLDLAESFFPKTARL